MLGRRRSMEPTFTQCILLDVAAGYIPLALSPENEDKENIVIQENNARGLKLIYYLFGLH